MPRRQRFKPSRKPKPETVAAPQTEHAAQSQPVDGTRDVIFDTSEIAATK